MRKKNAGLMLIRAPHDKEGIWRWLYQDAKGTTESGELSGVIPDVVAPVVLLLPSGRCFFHRYPRDGKKRLPTAKMLLWQAEESLLCDAEQLHASITGKDDAFVYLSAVDRQMLNSWLQYLNARGLKPDAIFPDVMFLPQNGYVCIDGDWIIRINPGGGEYIPEALFPVWPDKSLIEKVKDWDYKPGEQNPMLQFTGHVPPGRGLLCGDYRVKFRLRGMCLSWPLLGVGILWLVTLCLQPFSEAWQLYRQVKEKETQINTAVRQVVPEIPDDVDPILWLRMNLPKNNQKKSSDRLTDALNKNRDFLNGIGQGTVRGMTWSSESNTLTLNVHESSDKLAVFAAQYSGKERTITLKKRKGSKATVVVIQEMAQ